MIPLRRLILFAVLAMPLAAIATEDDVEGRWLSGDGDGWIRIQRVGESLTGVIAGSPNDEPDDPPQYDDKNPDR